MWTPYRARGQQLLENYLLQACTAELKQDQSVKSCSLGEICSLVGSCTVLKTEQSVELTNSTPYLLSPCPNQLLHWVCFYTDTLDISIHGSPDMYMYISKR